jgi:hypothetical protein
LEKSSVTQKILESKHYRATLICPAADPCGEE